MAKELMHTHENAADDASRARPLGEFIEFFADFNSMYAQIAKFAMAAPLIDLVTQIGPPWPSRLAVGFLVVAIQLLLVMSSFALWRQGRTPLRIIKRWLVGGAIMFVATIMFVYIPCFAFFIKPNPSYSNAVVGGFQLTPDAKELSEGMNLSETELLVEFQRDPNRVWTTKSLALSRSLVLVIWLSAAVFYGIGVSAFVAIQYRRFS